MRSKKSKRAYAVILPGFLLATDAVAQSSFTNSFTGFTGDSSLLFTRDSLAAAGFGVTDPGKTDEVAFGVTGARFGGNLSGDGGRNYIRTLPANYATVNFEAQITFVTTNDTQQAYVGLGGGEIALWGSPDWSTQLSSGSAWLGNFNNQLATFRTHDDINAFHLYVRQTNCRRLSSEDSGHRVCVTDGTAITSVAE